VDLVANWKRIAADLGVGVGTIYRLARSLSDQPPVKGCIGCTPVYIPPSSQPEI
jgi:hypothetical protein